MMFISLNMKLLLLPKGLKFVLTSINDGQWIFQWISVDCECVYIKWVLKG